LTRHPDPRACPDENHEPHRPAAPPLDAGSSEAFTFQPSSLQPPTSNIRPCTRTAGSRLTRFETPPEQEPGMNENDHTRTRPPERPDEPVNLPEDRTIRSSRTLQATRARVWPLFENRADLVAWWGPSGFVNTFEEFDFNPGGA